LEEINGDLLEADFGTTSRRGGLQSGAAAQEGDRRGDATGAPGRGGTSNFRFIARYLGYQSNFCISALSPVAISRRMSHRGRCAQTGSC